MSMTGEGRKGPVYSRWYLVKAIAFSSSLQPDAAKSVRLNLAQGKSWQGYGFKSSPLEAIAK
ncbi:hypothetical protein [Laspinema palackyanum]|uniref:hypothetical protein n=1 Tax=Laspinema palackyanum TaxID=3231601 RepID=UPI00345D013E|nr:hypothetical protein [Laspinema sp. D2c]